MLGWGWADRNGKRVGGGSDCDPYKNDIPFLFILWNKKVIFLFFQWKKEGGWSTNFCPTTNNSLKI